MTNPAPLRRARAAQPRDVALVGIGASLGGFEAVERLLAAIPPALSTAIAVVLHRSSDGQSQLAHLLGRRSAWPVLEAEDKSPISRGHVYLAPANYHLLVERGALALSVDAPVCFARPSIDVLFETLGRAYGPSAVAIILTGASEDGAAGAALARKLGARIMVQDPDTAVSPVAPRTVLSRVEPDFTGTLDEIAATLSDWCGRSVASETSTASPGDG